MKKTLILSAFILVLAAIAELLLPYWWLAAVAGFAVCAGRADSGWQAFIAGFLGVFVLWLGYAIYIDQATNSILTLPMADLLKPIVNGVPLTVFSSLIGGLATGLAGLSGFLFKRALRKK